MPERDGYCEHGVYVGGCGIDWMCGYCESGVTVADLEERDAAMAAAKALEAQRLIAYRAVAHATSEPEAQAAWLAFWRD